MSVCVLCCLVSSDWRTRIETADCEFSEVVSKKSEGNLPGEREICCPFGQPGCGKLSLFVAKTGLDPRVFRESSEIVLRRKRN